MHVVFVLVQVSRVVHWAFFFSNTKNKIKRHEFIYYTHVYTKGIKERKKEKNIKLLLYYLLGHGSYRSKHVGVKRKAYVGVLIQ